MCNSLRLSVRLMTFNHEEFIVECLQGIEMQQTSFDFEVVIGDDFSTDNNLTFIKEFISKSKNQKIKYRLLSRNQEDEYFKERQKKGRLFNFIDILNNCDGKYIALLDGDDYWTDPHKLQKQVDYMEAHPTCVLTGHDAIIVDSNGNIIKKSKLPEEKKRDATQEELKLGFWVLTVSMLIRNIPEIFLNYPKEAVMVKNGDTFLTSILGQYGCYHYMSEIKPAVYRVHTGGVWSLNGEVTKLINSSKTKYYTGVFFHQKGDPFARKLFERVTNIGLSAIEKSKEKNEKITLTGKKEIFKLIVHGHFLTYGFVRSIKFSVKTFAKIFF